ncbi:lysosomal thioesterase PPT2-like [Engraulis encrasicolus]|uniref:lysosomal thioesterase PPT2-like n=1 Tax=Engraulis encrasicolus TaxID=184585 RepID=UPI002FD3723C
MTHSLCLVNWSFLCLLLVCKSVAVTDGYKPVILVHGLLDGPGQFRNLINFITESHPGTTVIALDLYNEEDSLKSLWEQVEGFNKAIYPIMQSSPEGVHLICYSQGGVICRGILATLADHNVHSAIFLSAPLAGQYGGLKNSTYWWSAIGRRMFYLFCYNKIGQLLSICNYWNDPYHQKSYLRGNTYLAPLNGDQAHDNITSWKDNFLRIKKLVLIGGRDDGLITPWQSSFFGFYDEKGNVIDMKNQDWYLKDAFGLKTLDMRKDLKQCEVDGIDHLRWPHAKEVYADCIEEWLN